MAVTVFTLLLVSCGDDDSDVESPATTASAEMCDVALQVYDTAIRAWHAMGETTSPTVQDLIDAQLLAPEGTLGESELGDYVDVVNGAAQPGPAC